MSVITIKELLEAGVHFGHQTHRWNPKMKKYIFESRNGIYIIDLQKTVVQLEEAYKFIRDIVSSGQEVLFVGTKKQAKESIKEAANKCGMYYVNERWLGGTLTNFVTIKKSISRLNEIEKQEEEGLLENFTKKEVVKIGNEKTKLKKYLEGIRDMKKIPGVVFIVDPKREKIAIMEAKKLKISVIALVDTNCDPDLIDIPIPGNDDAMRTIALMTGKIADAALEGTEEKVKLGANKKPLIPEESEKTAVKETGGKISGEKKPENKEKEENKKPIKKKTKITEKGS